MPTYTSAFPATENPISEGGRWVNGATTGLDWHDVRTSGVGAFGTQPGSGATDDSLAVLTGIWGPNQTVTETVRTINQPAGNIFTEIECLLRFNITAHNAIGYEVNFSINKNYTQIVRWNGSLGSFSLIQSLTLATLTTGDILKATITGTGTGTTITGFLNGTQVIQATDDGSHGGTAYSTGNPGMGFYTDSPVTNSDYSITLYSATDGLPDPTTTTLTMAQMED